MSQPDQIAIIAALWALAWFALSVVLVHCHHWRYTALSFGLAVFFARFSVRFYAGGHDVAWFGWAIGNTAILVTMLPCVVLTIGLAVEVVVRGKLVQ